MLSKDELDGAVGAEVLSAEQADRLAAYLAGRAGASRDEVPAVAGEDEKFRLFNGFNDVFLATGVALVSAASVSQIIGREDHPALVPIVIGVALSWGLAEVLVGRHRALLPGIVLCASLALFVGILMGTVLPDVLGVAQVPMVEHEYVTKGVTEHYQAPDPKLNTGELGLWGTRHGTWTIGLWGSLVASLAFYARFRFPFALMAAGITAAWAVIFATYWAWGKDGYVPAQVLALMVGLSLFALAMRFDASDTKRLTRRADCGFWLHLAAAPFIVYPLLSLAEGGLGKEGTGSALVVLAVASVLALVALIVDRRALLVSSLLSLGLAIGYLIKTAAIPPDAAVTVTLGVLGLFVVVLGLGWHKLRALVLAPLSGRFVLNYVPQVTP